MVGGILFVVATLLHPSQETAQIILETETSLVASHAVYIISYVLILLALPTLHSTLLASTGRPGRWGFLVTFVGVSLLAISSQFGFIAPVLASEAPVALDAIVYYPPVIAFNAVAAISFMGGFIILGIVIAKAVARWSGIAIAVGAPVHLIGFGVAQLGSPGLWFIAIAGAVLLGGGLALVGRLVPAGST